MNKDERTEVRNRMLGLVFNNAQEKDEFYKYAFLDLDKALNYIDVLELALADYAKKENGEVARRVLGIE